MATPAVTFDYDAWVAAYPEFIGLSKAQATGYFNRAGLLFSNDTFNPAFGAGVMPMLFDLLTAHVAWINAPRDDNGNPASVGQPAAPLVGRINSASEGSVNVSTEYNSSGSPSEAYFLQTKYGTEFWQASAQFRTARYRAHPTRVVNGVFPSFPSAVR